MTDSGNCWVIKVDVDSVVFIFAPDHCYLEQRERCEMIVFPTAHTSHSLFIGGFADQALAFFGHECSLSVPSNTLSKSCSRYSVAPNVHMNTANPLMNAQLVSLPVQTGLY